VAHSAALDGLAAALWLSREYRSDIEPL